MELILEVLEIDENEFGRGTSFKVNQNVYLNRKESDWSMSYRDMYGKDFGILRFKRDIDERDTEN